MVENSTEYSFFNPRPQILALPQSFQTQILKNVMPKVHAKLIRTCKLFFHLKPLIPICDASSFGRSLITSFDRLSNGSRLTSLLWFGGELNLIFFAPSLIRDFFHKVHKFTLTKIHMHTVFGMTYANYLCLTESKTIEKFYYTGGQIKYSLSGEDDDNVPCEAVLKELPNVVEFRGNFFIPSKNHDDSSKTHNKTLSTLPKFLKLREFAVYNIDKHFNVVDVCNFIRNHPHVEFSFKDIKNRLFKEAIERTAQGIGAVVEF